MTTSTPWGASQYSDKIATGIMVYGTAGHGGVHLSTKRNALMPDYMRNNNGWYEEDCEWALVACVFPDEYLAHYEARLSDIVDIAKATMLSYFPDQYEKFFGVEVKEGESPHRDRENFKKRHVNSLLVSSAMLQDDGMVKCLARVGGDTKNEVQWFMVPHDEYNTRGANEFVIDPEKHKKISG